jgi:hypothetical protein
MRRIHIIALLVLVVAVCGSTDSATAQVPQTMSYQGVLTDGAGSPVPDGSYDIAFSLYTVVSGGTAIWTETQSVQVTGGIFSVILGSQAPLTVAFDQPYWLGVSVDGGQEFSPRRELTAAAYSLNARSLASGQAVTSLNTLTDDVTLAGGDNVTITTSNDSIIVSSSGGGASLDWSLTGNAGTTPGTHFLGTTDNQALEIHVNGARAIRFEPDATSPNIVGGSAGNGIIDGAVGATIGGGGGEGNTYNTVSDNYGTISGGGNNVAGDRNTVPGDRVYATVSGGYRNQASGRHSAIGGGQFNTVSGQQATIGGGAQNNAINLNATVAGGSDNDANGQNSTVAGGTSNAAHGNRSTIGGGSGNTVFGLSSTISGGALNEVAGELAFVGGGLENHADADKAVVGGGQDNDATGESSVIAGGDSNIASAQGAAVAGGMSNVAAGEYAFAAGGADNVAAGGYSFAAGRQAQANHGGSFVWADSSDNAPFATTAIDQFLIRAAGGVGIGTTTPTQELEVAGTVKMDGFELTVGPSAGYVLTSDATGHGSWQPSPGGSVWGLSGNAGTTPGTDFLGTTDNQALEIHVNSARAMRIEPDANSPNIVVGYSGNLVVDGAVGATISGGGGESGSHSIVSDNYGTIGGGNGNIVGDSDGIANNRPYATVSGGRWNQATGMLAAVGGGVSNVATGEATTIGGGNQNRASDLFAAISGGYFNEASADGASVGGGRENTAGGAQAVVAGGNRNSATANRSTVGGGQGNSATSAAATVGGGQTNFASDQAATVGGGRLNVASGQYSFVGGGDSDTASGTYSTVGGGRDNKAGAGGSVVSGGFSNAAGGNSSTVSGGNDNEASGSTSTVCGGGSNSASGTLSTVLGGYHNDAAAAYSVAAGLRSIINQSHVGAFLYADYNEVDFNSAAGNEFAVRATGGVRFVTAIDGTGTPTAGVSLSAGGSSWNTISDRNAKENIAPVDGVDILNRLDGVEISEWNYKTQDESVRHIGPMAQDFYSAFGLGEDQKRINTVDADGVALAAIKGLKELVKQKDAQIDELERRLAKLEEAVRQLSNESE